MDNCKVGAKVITDDDDDDDDDKMIFLLLIFIFLCEIVVTKTAGYRFFEHHVGLCRSAASRESFLQ